MADSHRIATLLIKKLEDDLRPAEGLELEAWLDQGDNRDFYFGKYDVKVKFEGEPSTEKKKGPISRNQNLEETLVNLKALNIHTSMA